MLVSLQKLCNIFLADVQSSFAIKEPAKY